MGLRNKIKKALNTSDPANAEVGNKQTKPLQKQIDAKPVCPNCGVLLEKSPKRKTTCPSCSKAIYYRGT